MEFLSLVSFILSIQLKHANYLVAKKQIMTDIY